MAHWIEDHPAWLESIGFRKQTAEWLTEMAAAERVAQIKIAQLRELLAFLAANGVSANQPTTV